MAVLFPLFILVACDTNPREEKRKGKSSICLPIMQWRPRCTGPIYYQSVGR